MSNMEEYLGKSKRRPSLAHKQYPANQPAFKPPPRASVQLSVPAAGNLQDHHHDAVANNINNNIPISDNNNSVAEQRPTRAPRKRFRKKVTGLFGDQTDLHKRMQKLLRPLSQDILVKKRNNVTDTSPTNIELEQIRCDKPIPSSNAPAMKKNGPANPDASTGGSTMSTRALASIAKWKKFSNRIGRMSPRSNELFLNEVEVCTPMNLDHRRSLDRPDPPTLPALGNTLSPGGRYLSTDDEGCRTGTPAMLRRKVRRNERGYRGVDIIRIRSSTMEGADSVNARRGGNNTGLDVYVRSLGGMARRARSEMKGGDTVEGGTEKANGMTRRARSEMTSDGRRSAPKRRRVSDETSSSETDGYQYDAFSLLIEAAEKEGERTSSSVEGSSPLRKAKRLRSHGCMTTVERSEAGSDTDRIRRHTTMGMDKDGNSNGNSDLVHATGAERLEWRRRKRSVEEMDGGATEDED